MSRLTFSIVINTYNRATSLVNTLESMFYLRHPAYEVIVVNGPSTDHTQALIEQYAENIKIGQCAETNLAKSRNIGIGMASGDIVCFIDDDGIPEPDWLDQLEQVYLAHPEAGGVGGFVRDHTGVDYQTKYIVCNRQGEAQFYYDEMDASVVPQSPWQARYPSLIGVNSSFRRQALLQIGGFDEEYAYFLDETDVCVRLVDAGWQIMFAPKAEVHHKYAPSHLRNNKKVPTSLFYTCRSKVYFLFRNATPTSSFLSILREANNVRHQIIAQANGLKLLGAIDAKHHASLLDDGERGFHDGVADAFAYPAGQPMPAEKRQHLSFKACLPRVRADLRLNVILLSREYPPTTCGGIGVFVHRLAEALAAGEPFLIDEKTHQLRHCHGRVGIIQLEGNLLIQLCDIIVMFFIFCNCSLYACRNKEILLFQTKFFSCILIGSRAKNKSAGGILPNQSGFFGGVFGSEFSSYIKLYILERRTNSNCCLIIIIRQCCGENHSLSRRNPVLSRHFNFFGSSICLFPYKGTGIKCGC